MLEFNLLNKEELEEIRCHKFDLALQDYLRSESLRGFNKYKNRYCKKMLKRVFIQYTDCFNQYIDPKRIVVKSLFFKVTDKNKYLYFFISREGFFDPKFFETKVVKDILSKYVDRIIIKVKNKEGKYEKLFR